MTGVQTCALPIYYYIGIRGAWTKDAADLLSGGEALWQALTAGAVSTVTKEG